MKPTLAFGEFVTLMALMIALTALSIDAMLPALPEIGRDLDVSGENDSQLVIGSIFLGKALGQMFYGQKLGRISPRSLGFISYDSLNRRELFKAMGTKGDTHA